VGVLEEANFLELRQCEVHDGKKDECRGTLVYMGESTGDENSNLYIRGVNEGRSGELM
jgi:hypothetical protein